MMFNESEAFLDGAQNQEYLPPEVLSGYSNYAQDTWNGIREMIYPNGLPADQLHYLTVNDWPSENTTRIDRTSPTNIGFSLACIGAAEAMGFIPPSEAYERIDTTLNTIDRMMKDPQVFLPTGDGDKGLFVNWIQPSTGNVLRQWSENEVTVKQHLSTVDNAWFIAFSQLVSSQFPQFEERIHNYLERMDLSFMFDPELGFFHGCYMLNPLGFESWYYDVLSEARIAYLVCGGNIAASMSYLIKVKSERSIFRTLGGLTGRACYDGQYFQWGWPSLIVPEGELNAQWEATMKAAVQAQKDFGEKYNDGYYGYSAGLDPDGHYYEFRVPDSGESRDVYMPQPVITISALVNMGLVEPVETYRELLKLHQQFPRLKHQDNGDGDTVNAKTGAVQRDQVFPNQAVSLLACWNIVGERQPQNLFMRRMATQIRDVYENIELW